MKSMYMQEQVLVLVERLTDVKTDGSWLGSNVNSEGEVERASLSVRV